MRNSEMFSVSGMCRLHDVKCEFHTKTIANFLQKIPLSFHVALIDLTKFSIFLNLQFSLVIIATDFEWLYMLLIIGLLDQKRTQSQSQSQTIHQKKEGSFVYLSQRITECFRIKENRNKKKKKNCYWKAIWTQFFLCVENGSMRKLKENWREQGEKIC